MVTVAAASVKDDEDDFSRPCSSAASTTPSDELQQYLSSLLSQTISIAASPALKARFLRLNTPLPASATAEQMFSCAGLTMNSLHTTMTDDLFEDLVLLKKNRILLI